MIRRLGVLALIVTGLWAQSDLDKGIARYKQRADGQVKGIAQMGPISEAITYFEKAKADPATADEANLYLLKSYYYLGKYVYQDDEKKKAEFNRGVDLGVQLIKKYPENIAFRYWYLVNLGSWAEVYGILAAAKEGVADQMKLHSEYIIAHDPTYNDGAGYFMLGAVHFKSPYIPFLLSWPDNKVALANMEKAVSTGFATPTQKVYLARITNKLDQKPRSLKLLNEVINTPPRPTDLVEDMDEIKEAKTFLAEFSK